MGVGGLVQGKELVYVGGWTEVGDGGGARHVSRDDGEYLFLFKADVGPCPSSPWVFSFSNDA